MEARIQTVGSSRNNDTKKELIAYSIFGLPMASQINVDGCLFEASIDYLSFGFSYQFKDVTELKKLSQFPNLKQVSLATSNLDDVGLAHVCHAATIEYLDLQDTEISDAGLKHLLKLPNLKTLRLKDNLQLTNECVTHLSRLTAMLGLQFHETSINQDGLRALTRMSQLQDICLSVDEGNYSFEALIEISRQMPNCAILAKGNGEFLNGQFDGCWDP